MKIELRSRKHKSGNTTLYLEFYEKGGKRQYESLNLYLIPEMTDNDRRVNEATLKKALKIKSERILGIGSKSGEKDISTPATEFSKGRQILACVSEAYAEYRQHCQVISCSHPPSQSHNGQGGQVLLQEFSHIYQRCVPKHKV